MKVVVDTNVPAVANDESQQASPECVRNCARRLIHITERGKVVLDDGWLILREYKAHLRLSGQLRSGDAFLKWVLTNYMNPDRCELVKITRKNASQTDFEEFPSDPDLQAFHTKDRKFVAVALAHSDRPPILQAVDSKWWKMREQLRKAGVKIEFLCPRDISAIAKQNG